MEWNYDGSKQTHRLFLPPLPISPFMPTISARADNPMSPTPCWEKGALLGNGIFGDVYVCFNGENGELRATKEVTLFSDDAKYKESAKQLVQEITLFSSLRHPNIVQYYGSEVVGDKLYIFQEYIAGGSIYKLLQEYGQFGETVIRSFTQQILSGLAYLHAKNIAHRNIKGANVLVDAKGRVKLADFGLPKHVNLIMRKSHPLIFLERNAYWIAPEVIKNSNDNNLAADIWSLGCTVLEMTAAMPPWGQYERSGAMFKIVHGKELPPIPDHVSSEGKDFVMKCLQRDAHNRPSATELLDHPFVKSVAPLGKPILWPEAENPEHESETLISKNTKSRKKFGSIVSFLSSWANNQCCLCWREESVL